MKSNAREATGISKKSEYMLCLGLAYALHSRLFIHMKRAKSKYNIWKEPPRFAKKCVNVKHFACVISGSLHNKTKVLADKDQ